MSATVIDDRFHKNIYAEVAPLAQFVQDGTIAPNASDFSGVTNRTVSAQTELVTRHGHGHRDALSAESFAASYFLTYSSSIAPSLITWKSAVFDKSLITASSKVSQNRIVDGEIEKI